MKCYSGYQYLQIDIANNFGLDKELFETRIDWVNTHHKELEQLANQADNRPQYIKAVMALRRAEKGEAIGHIVFLDAICSGIQIMSAVTGCYEGANITGLVQPNVRSDAYTSITDKMNEILHSEGVQVNVSRQDAKDAIMPRFYGSTDKPKEIFGEGVEHEAFLQACRACAPGADELLVDLLQSWRKGALKHSWRLPDGFQVHCKVMESVKDRIEVDELGHSTFTYQYLVNQGSDKGLSNAANVVHSIDAYILRTMLRRCNYDPMLVKHFHYRFTEELLARENGTSLGSYVDKNVSKYMDLYAQTNMVDTVILTVLTDDTVHMLSTDHLRALNRVLSTMLEHKPFELVTVHDA